MKRFLCLIGVGAWALLAVTNIAVVAAPGKPTYRLQSGRKPGHIDRVTAVLEVGGELKELVDHKVHRAKLSVVCNLRYDERTLEVAGNSSGSARSIRAYDQAEAVIKVEEDGLKPQLRKERRLIGAKADAGRLTLFCPRGPLSRDELDLIDILADSLLLDRLLPTKPVAVGQAWKHPRELFIAMLGLDEADKVDVQSTLTSVDGNLARMQLTGRVEGAIGGVSTRIELKGKYRFDRKTKRIDWFGLMVKEDRDIGHVADGVDAVARLQYRITPLDDCPALADAALEGLPLKPTAELTRLVHNSSGGDWQLTHDRDWHVIGDRADLIVLRLLDRGELVAQCNVAPLPQRQPEKLTSLEQFQADVKKALGKSFGEFVEAGQFANESDYRVYRVKVRGEVKELPIHWSYYLVADEHGHQAAFAFTVEQSLVKRMNKADEKLIAALRFVEPQTAKKKTSDLR